MKAHSFRTKTLVLLSIPAMVAAMVLVSHSTSLAGPPPGGAGGAVQRLIEDFLVNQGTYCFPNPNPPPPCLLFVPPIQNFMGWGDPERNLLASVDYAGLADQWIKAHTNGAITFNTQFSGGILERPLPDGRAEVTVRLFTHNALCWVVEGDNFATSPLVFGCRAPDVVGGMQPALAESFWEMTFINTAMGAPIPDLLQLVFEPAPGQEGPTSLKCAVHAFGTTTPGGVPALMQMMQRGLFVFSPGEKWPVEHILIREIGS